MQFIQEHLLWILALLIAIILISFLIKQAIRIVMILISVSLIAVLIFGVKPDFIFKQTKEVSEVTQQYYQTELKPIIDKELKDFKYSKKENGSFTITTESMKIEGTLGDPFVFVTIKGEKKKVSVEYISDALVKVEKAPLKD